MIPTAHQKDYSVSGISILLVDDDSCSVSRTHELLTYSDLKEFSLGCVTSLSSAVSKFFGNAHVVLEQNQPLACLKRGLERIYLCSSILW